MAKILNIDYNDYKRKFISIQIEHAETCRTEPYISQNYIDFFPVDPSGQTHHIQIHKRYFSTGLTGQPIGSGYGSTWAVGAGSGAAMGWSLGLTLEVGMNAARSFCSVIESHELVARVYLNLADDMTAYSNDEPLPLAKISN